MRLISFLFLFLLTASSFSQVLNSKQGNYTRADSLRGSLRPERTSFDVLSYELNVKVEPAKKFISGVNHIKFKTTSTLPEMQLDLFENMKIDSIVFEGKTLNYKREFNAVFIDFPTPLKKNQTKSLSFYYSGNPIIAKNPPWDGGFIFTKDKNGKDWVSVAVQGTGASLWYPNKDHLSDEPESAIIHISAPNNLMAVSNGKLVGKETLDDDFTKWSWQVTNPINNYNIILNIGDYDYFSDTYQGMELNYYVLCYNFEKAKKQFEQVKPMMDCFYEKIGPYPFLEDSYKLVETPFLGMEHQSAVAYGNRYANGYLGRDLSGTGVGLKWDFIIVHETAHEWFGNSLTAKDIADMWIHESFTSYAEAIYVECQFGKEEALTYLRGLAKNMVGNRKPIIGDYGVNKEGSSDMYYKGANMINTLRSLVNDDEEWWNLLKNFTSTFKHQQLDTPIVVNFFEEETGLQLKPFFDQYLKYIELPYLEFKQKNNQLYFRWKTDVENFKMSVEFINRQNETLRLKATQDWKKLDKNFRKDDFNINYEKFYITSNLNDFIQKN